MPTEWTTYGVPNQKALMTDGTVGVMPEIEQTLSSRPRYRIKGTTKSFGKKDIDAEVAEYMMTTKGHAPVKTINSITLDSHLEEALKRHSIREEMETAVGRLRTGHGGGQVRFITKFAHRESGAVAYLQTHVDFGYNLSYATIRTFLTHPGVLPHEKDYPYLGNSCEYYWYNEPSGRVTTADRSAMAQLCAYTQEVKPHVLNPGIAESRTVRGVDMRTMLRRVFDTLLTQDLKVTHNMDTLKIPFFYKSIYDPTFATIEFENTGETSWDPSDLQVLADYVNPGEHMEAAAAAFTTLVKALRLAGFNVQEPNAESVLAELISGEVPSIAMVENNHSVCINPITGTAQVTCPTEHIQAAMEEYQVARFQAEVSGREEEFEQFIGATTMVQGIRDFAIREIEQMQEMRELAKALRGEK